MYLSIAGVGRIISGVCCVHKVTTFPEMLVFPPVANAFPHIGLKYEKLPHNLFLLISKSLQTLQRFAGG